MKEKDFNLLIVDDTPANIDLLSGILLSEYNIKVATNGSLALKLAEQSPKPDLILLDVMMPQMDGYEVCTLLKSNPVTATIPVIFVTAKCEVEDETKGFDIGAVDYIVKPISPPVVKSRVATHLALHNQRRTLEQQVHLRTQEIRENQLEIISCLGRAAEFKDNETGMHVVRMSHYSRILAEALNIEQKWCQLLFEASPMHDIGKIGVADNILKKNGSLTPEEWEHMKEHVNYGVQILGDHKSELIDMARQIIEYHHEKWDGSGYPKGVLGEEIPLSARIVMIADVFDALTSDRPYKEAWPVEEAFSYLQEHAGTHFDRKLVDVFLTQKAKILDVKASFAD
ncbi:MULTISPECIES: HD domain-containing phosphohydrolase [Vibrio]|jgi:putative two-component system response regulator|uniref:Two-component system response regulator n=1 Tax=Vibrio mediterranei TaxID=689 RepID=A0AAN1FH49_9VIBR|nr:MULTISPECIES: HD domain-containing phosphohydrolase [Vibrio]ASI90488.1 two-component system response regulator [Vibrio mediterranei]KFA99524.1 chemotaxis protein CheY [Vibrio sp. ER1A]MCG9627233.1 response regulator [Vibrio mediterranei]MCG9660273.1 response regulator [Vibrio mediterranei]MCG9665913.1 response regulator [Vibrio mediterranei]